MPLRKGARDMESLGRNHTCDGSRPLVRLNGFDYMNVVLGGGCPHKVVPESYWTQAETADGEAAAASLSCPCGTTVTVELAACPVKCDGCERWYFFAGTEVLALLSPVA